MLFKKGKMSANPVRGDKKVKRIKMAPDTLGSARQTGLQVTEASIEHQPTCISEDEEIKYRDVDKDYALFRSTTAEIRAHLKELLDMKRNKLSEEDISELYVQVCLHFVSLKKLNRLDKYRCKRARDSVNEVKQKVDNFHLQLQNMMYEVMHLQKEAGKCLEFRSKDEEIDLVPIDEFYREAPLSVSRMKETKKNPHQMTLARLEWELEQRKRLAEKLRETESKKQVFLKEIEKKKECLESLRPTLKSILEATQPLHSELGMPLQVTQLKHEMARHLPRPLYVLYVRTCAYREACDRSLTVTIEGNLEEAKALQSRTDDKFGEDDSGDSDQEEAAAVKRHRRSTSGKEGSSQKLLTTHPLSVVLTFPHESNVALSITFVYLSHLQIVCIRSRYIPGQPSAGNGASNVLKPDTLLNCLFPGDTGKESPNPTNGYQLKKVGISSIDPLFGRPYMWAQRLAGLEFLPQAGDSHSSALAHPSLSAAGTSFVEMTAQAIGDRLLARMTLYSQLLAFEQGRVSVPSGMSDLFLPKTGCCLKAWSTATWEDILLHPSCNELADMGIISEDTMTFRAILERSSAKLKALVLVSSGYPKVAPFFLLTVHWKLEETSKTDDALRELEREVNIHAVGLVSDHLKPYVLTVQMQQLLIGWDIYLETSFSPVALEGPREFSCGKVFTHVSRGRNHNRPYKYIPKLGLFTQRL